MRPSNESREVDQASFRQGRPRASVWDLDGTLLTTDLFAESILRLVRARPWRLVSVLGWMLRGRAHCKGQVAQALDSSWTTWPVRPEAEARIREARASGAPVLLATAAHERAASRLAAELGLFDAVLATTGGVNLKGRAKRDAIADWVRQEGCKGYVYAGDSAADLNIWRDAEEIIMVDPTPSLERQARRLGKPVSILGPRTNVVRSIFSAMRPHQWAKNLLLFVPMILAHTTDPGRGLLTGIAFVAFSACASTVYILNDLFDLESDREHPKKRSRPFASGALSIAAGVKLAAVLLGVALALSIGFLPLRFLVVLAVYLIANVGYSGALKRQPIIDVMMLSAMYSLRIEAGSAAAGVFLSPWIFAFSLFFFTSLAFAKRFTELRRVDDEGGTHASGRGYRVDDIAVLESLGAASGYVSVLVLALYMNSTEMRALYGDSQLLWLICPLVMYWITRVWLLARRGELDEDPVVFALHDRVSLGIAVACAGLIGVATWLASVTTP